MAECNHDCSSCKEECKDRVQVITFNEFSNVRKTIGIVSGKGGVGKSLVTSLLACASAKLGYSSAILDADILGPSIPKIFGVKEKAYGDETGKYITMANGPLDIGIISSAMLLENDSDPIIWRGSLVSNFILQLYSNVIYGKRDALFIDMPPGTGDVVLTVFQSIKLDGIVIVTSPQDLVSTIVKKAIKMANMMNIPILGIVENYAYVKCPKCDERIELFGKSKAKELAKEYNIPFFVSLPLDGKIATHCDNGTIHQYDIDCFDKMVKDILK